MSDIKDSRELAKKVFSQIEKEDEEKQIKELKQIITKYLEKIKILNDKKEVIEKELKILKNDLDDIKEGRLDKIKERQTIDPDAKKVSVIIIKEKVYPPAERPWQQPWIWYWNPAIDTTAMNDLVLYGNATTNLGYVDCNYVLTSNISKNYSAGTYAIQHDGQNDIVYFK